MATKPEMMAFITKAQAKKYAEKVHKHGYRYSIVPETKHGKEHGYNWQVLVGPKLK
jgi:hypothetical protein